MLFPTNGSYPWASGWRSSPRKAMLCSPGLSCPQEALTWGVHLAHSALPDHHLFYYGQFYSSQVLLKSFLKLWYYLESSDILVLGSRAPRIEHSELPSHGKPRSCDGILLSNQKEETTDAPTWLNLTCIRLSERSQKEDHKPHSSTQNTHDSRRRRNDRVRKQTSIARDRMWLTPRGAGGASGDGPVLHLSVRAMSLLCAFMTRGTGC